jgi:adenosyl cobinamide kinase/adenosyl cobinamide phosphate guanylyltransferase
MKEKLDRCNCLGGGKSQWGDVDASREEMQAEYDAHQAIVDAERQRDVARQYEREQQMWRRKASEAWYGKKA